MSDLTVADLAQLCQRMVDDGEGDRVVDYQDHDGPELWAVLPWTPDNDAEPGMLFLAALGDG